MSVCSLLDLAVLAKPRDLTNKCACLTDFCLWNVFEPCQLLLVATSRISVLACIRVGPRLDLPAQYLLLV